MSRQGAGWRARVRRAWSRTTGAPRAGWGGGQVRAGESAGEGGRGGGRGLVPRSVAGQVFALQWTAVVLLVAVAAVLLVWQTRTSNLHNARDRSLAAAAAVADAPSTVAGLSARNPTKALQPVAERVVHNAEVDYVVIVGADRVEYTDTVPGRIGRRVTGDYAAAWSGHPYTALSAGHPRDYVRAVVPVDRPDGTVVGIVTTGVSVATVGSTINRELPLVMVGAVAALVLAALAAVMAARRLSRQTRGLGPAEVTRLYEHHDAVLHSVKEGVLVVGSDRRLALANDEARRLLALPDDAEGAYVGDLRLDPALADLLVSQRPAADEVHIAADDRRLAVNQRPTGGTGGQGGTVATLRDVTELRELADRAETTAQRLRLLYEAGARIGTTLDLVRTAEELAAVAVPRFADVATVDLLDPVVGGDEPTPANSAVMRRVAVRGITDDQAHHGIGTAVPVRPGTPQARGLEQHRAMLVPDLAADRAWHDLDPGLVDRVLHEGFHSMISVPMRARGTVLGLANFWRRGPAPFQPDDLDSAEELVARAAVCVDNARRYTREHSLAVSLQRSLLPAGLPEQNAVEAAYRYLPARAGVGGDWFDVIALPGARVALVVGDVVGHGVHAAATMGRLRTAVHNFSALDLPPDELLAHLEELVVRIDAGRRGADHEGAPVTGATMLYAVYDPADGRCQMASAGHPPPALHRPGGAVEFLAPPPNLPLGLGNSPYETLTVELPEGSCLVLYTDGLVERRGQDIGTGLDLLRTALAAPGRTCEEMCGHVLDTLLPTRPQDDVALLVAAARRLDPARVAQWDVEPDPAAVGPVRAACVRTMADWQIGDAAFTAELLLSELITNAVRYGRPPITVRLLCDRYLTCEVSDASSSAPHLRKASALDEGGRGLFLIAQLAGRWGTRYTERGKTIWTEQPLTATEEEPLGL